MRPALLAIAALVPAMLGVPPQPAASGALTATLCSGGTISIPILGRERERPPCAPKACHAACDRRRLDPAQ